MMEFERRMRELESIRLVVRKAPSFYTKNTMNESRDSIGHVNSEKKILVMPLH